MGIAEDIFTNAQDLDIDLSFGPPWAAIAIAIGAIQVAEVAKLIVIAEESRVLLEIIANKPPMPFPP